MRFTKKIKSRILEILHTEKKLPPAGSSCLYLQLNRWLGAKLYKNKRTRNAAIKSQKKLNELDLSPKAGNIFEIPVLVYNDFRETKSRAEIGYEFYYGYLTQHASKVDSRKDYRQISKFLKTIEELGYDTYDLENNWNIGKINNRIVCIDTDPRTLSRG